MISPRLLAAAFLASSLALCVPLVASAMPKPFQGPASGWDHTVGVTPTPQMPRAQETWKKNDGELLTYLSDGALSYDDTLAQIKKNMTDNGFKAGVDADRKCDGRRAHEFEMSLGPSVYHQVVIDDAPGLTKLTYVRPQGATPAADVTHAIDAYCGAAQ